MAEDLRAGRTLQASIEDFSETRNAADEGPALPPRIPPHHTATVGDWSKTVRRGRADEAINMATDVHEGYPRTLAASPAPRIGEHRNDYER